MLLSDKQVGDNLDLEVEGNYPCSDGGITTTVSVDKLLKAQLKVVIEWLDGFTFYDDAEGESAKAAVQYIKKTLLKEIE